MKQLTSEDLQLAAEILNTDGLVAFPTETVYGLGGNALSSKAVEKIFKAKGRPSDNPLIVHIAELKDIFSLIENFPDKAKTLAEKFWPGPLTMVFQASDKLPAITLAGLSTVAVRIPNHPVALALIKAAGLPLAAPSANISGQPSPTSAKHVIKDLAEKVEAVIDGGECSVGVESTVVDMTTEIPILLRPGGITLEMLEDAIGKVDLDKGLQGNKAPRSPGMKYTHYSPKAEVFLVAEHKKSLADKLDILLDINKDHELKTAFLVLNETAKYIKRSPDLMFSFLDAEEAAHSLYSALRACDDEGIDVIYCEMFKNTGIGLALMNRLKKAAGNKVL